MGGGGRFKTMPNGFLDGQNVVKGMLRMYNLFSLKVSLMK